MVGLVWYCSYICLDGRRLGEWTDGLGYMNGTDFDAFFFFFFFFFKRKNKNRAGWLIDLTVGEKWV